MSVWALIVAAGSGARMGLPGNKALAPLGGEAVLSRTVRAFDGLVDGVMIVARTEDMDEIEGLRLDAQMTGGGATRQDSVLAGLRALPEEAEFVLVHDAARPFVDRETILRCVESVRAMGSGVASVPVKDTIKQTREDGSVLGTPPRQTLRVAQTPQAFRARDLWDALEALRARGDAVTDDASAMELMGHRVCLVEGSYENIKLTTPEDMAMAEGMLGARCCPRVGQGYDVHRLVEGRALILCGVEVPYERGLLGHSDADVALHALMDAMLGAAAMGDIGTHFPDDDPRYKGASSLELLGEVDALLRGRGLYVGNADVTIVAQRPKLLPYRAQMVVKIARALRVPEGSVNVKATTTEGLGFEGEGLGISARAAVLLLPI